MIGYSYILTQNLVIVECITYSHANDTYLVIPLNGKEEEAVSISASRVIVLSSNLDIIKGRKSLHMTMKDYTNIEHQEKRCWRKYEKVVDTAPRVVVSCELGIIAPTFNLGDILCTNH